MRNQLTRGAARVRQAESEDDIVEPCLEQLEQRLAGDTTPLQRSLEDPAELFFHEAVLETEFLFLAQRDRVVGLLAAGTFRSMHSGRIIFPLERFGRSEKRHAVTAGDFSFGSGISGHLKKLKVER